MLLRGDGGAVAGSENAGGSRAMVAVYAVKPCASTRQALLALPSGTDCSTDEAAVAVGTAGPAAAPIMSLLLTEKAGLK